jgi:heme exporter protein CcmD
MIDMAAEHIGFVVACYAIVGVVLMGLVVHVVWRANRLKRQLAAQNLAEPGARQDT